MPKHYHRMLPRWPQVRLAPDEETGLTTADLAERDRVDGQIPSCQLGGWERFHKLVTDVRFERESFAFRGQRRYDWDLIPSLARGAAGGTFRKEDSEFYLESFRR